MPVCCGVVNCTSRSGRDKKSFYRLPAILHTGDFKKRLSEDRRQKWLLALRRADLNDCKMKWLRICEDHFITGKPAELYDVKNPDWVPSQKMGYTPKTSVHQQKKRKKKMVQHDKTASDLQSISEEYNMDIKCEIDELPNETVSESVNTDYNIDINCETYDVPYKVNVNEKSVECQTDLTIQDICNMEKVYLDSVKGQPVGQSIDCQTDLTRQDIRNTEKAYRDTVIELIEVRNKASKLCISEDTFKNDDERTRYYTGLQNFTTLMIVFNIVKKDFPRASASLSNFQQFILILMRIRLNLDYSDLAFRFCISRSTAARIFTSSISMFSKKLEKFLVWPDRDELIKEMPDSFIDAFGHKVAIMIKTFDVLPERSVHLPPSALTTSKYKLPDSIKFLIGICPKGTIAFISSAWEANTPDELIVENCGFFNQLLPDDILICDKGFNVNDEIELHCEVLRILGKHSKGRELISGIEDEEENEFSAINLAKLVERIIGKLKQFRILYRVMPLSTSNSNEGPAHIDQIVKVCCSLINISSLVVPLD